MSSSNKPKTKRVMYFSQPRSASNVFMKMIGSQPNWITEDYAFHAAILWGRRELAWGTDEQPSPERRDVLKSLLQDGWDKFESQIQTAEAEGKNIFMKNHLANILQPSELFGKFWPDDDVFHLKMTWWQPAENESMISTNPTFFPDDYLKHWQPVFLIRHPAAIFESLYRAHVKADVIEPFLQAEKGFTFEDVRAMYDWYASRIDTSRILVLDTEDMIDNPLVMKKFCHLCGLDPDFLAYQWDKMPQERFEGMRLIAQTFLSTIAQSNGIDPSKSLRNIDVEERARSWSEEYGEDAAKRLLDYTNAAMPDYEFLLSKKIRLD